MMILSVLLITIINLNQFHCRSVEELDNEVESNPGFNVVYDTWLQITTPPTPVITKEVGAHLELQCEARGSPPPTIDWYKKNRKITENESFETNVLQRNTALVQVASRLVINHLLPRHQDVYRCVARGGGLVATAASKVIISNKEGREMNFTQMLNAKIIGAHHMPRVTFWASTYMDVMGSEVALPCKFVGNPKPAVIWIDPQSKVIENSEKFSISQEGELRIRSVEWSDMGVYTCALENSMGEDSIQTFLYTMKRPEI